jgi:hypothetical protein
VIEIIPIHALDGKEWYESKLKNVRHIPDLGETNLFNLSLLTGLPAFQVILDGNNLIVKESGKSILVAKKNGFNYELQFKMIKKNQGLYLTSQLRSADKIKSEETQKETLKWHLRLSHASKAQMKIMVENKLVERQKASSLGDFGALLEKW